MPSPLENHPAAPIRISQSGVKGAFISWEFQESTDNPPAFLRLHHYAERDQRIFSRKGFSTPRGENIVPARACAARELVS